MPARVIALAMLICCGRALAVCEFDQTGTISNADDPECRDTQLVYTENVDTGNNIALGYPVPVPVDSLTAVDGFRTWASLHARHQDLMLTTSSVAGEVVGQTLHGREIWAYTLGDDDRLTPDGFAEGAVIVNGGIHAREWQTPEVLTEILEQLVETATDDAVGEYLHDHLTVVLVPVSNIDGFIQTQNFPSRATADERQPRDGRMRRKNMQNPSGSVVDEDLDTTGDSFYGVDLNRNSVHGFGLNNGSSDNAVSLVYRGAAFSSEPEIRALQAAATLAPADRLRLGVDVHSFTRVYFAPLTGNERRDDITRALASRMRAVTGFKYRFSGDRAGSQGIGTVADYFAYEFQVPAWTLETEPLDGGQDYGGTGASHSGFVLPDSEIARVRDELAETFMLGFYRQSGPPYVAALQVVNLARDEVVYDAHWVSDGGDRRLEVATSRAIVSDEDHRLWVAFSKPMRLLDANGVVTAFPGQNSRADRLEMNAPDESFTYSAELEPGPVVWLSQPGGAPDGYRRYRGDAFVRDLPFSQMPVPVDAPVSVAIQIDVTDLAEMSLDADPATPADWLDGHWTGYEDSALRDSDTGGADCRFVIYFAGAADAVAPPPEATCRAFVQATAPPPPAPPAPPPPASGGGGGGSSLWLLLTVLLARRR